ncbi:MAG: hypothetical protein AAB415_00790 [Patescibacteria group bacterium]
MTRRSPILQAFCLLFLLDLSLGIWAIQNVVAATDAVQVNLSVTAGSGGGGGPDPDPDPVPIPGCTDAAATNYNSAATADDGSCEYPPIETIPNVNGFNAVLEGIDVRLSWQNPSFANFAAVRIVRRIGSLPTGPTDGELIYDGSGETTLDTSVTFSTQYYYVAFVRDTAGEYSSGAVSNITTPAEEELPPDDEPPPDAEPPGGDGDDDGSGPGGDGDEPPGEVSDPFANLPEVMVTDPITALLKVGDFTFYQPGERQQFFTDDEDIFVIGRKPLSVTIPAGKLPEAMKTIGLTIIDPATRRPLGSYILKVTPDGANYTASIGNTFPNGIYPLLIYIINYQDQTIKRLTGRLVVSDGVAMTAIGHTLTDTARVLSPVAITIGLASGVIQGLALAERVGSAYDLYLIVLHGWTLLWQTLTLRRRPRPWGVVYDSVTKRPLDPAYVIVRKNDEDKGTAITDLDGRYAFFLPADTYHIIANKTHYQFPSQKLVGRTRDELYGNLYFGESLTTRSDEVVNRNIPLDPIAFDWNEFAKQAGGFFILHSRREARRRRILNLLYTIGFSVGLYNFIFHPSSFSIIIFSLYLLTALGQYLKHRIGARAISVKRASGLPVPFAIIRAFMPEVNQEIKAVVADALGRFFLLTPPGRYYITVEEKLPDETYQKIYQSPPLDLKNGVLTTDLIV